MSFVSCVDWFKCLSVALTQIGNVRSSDGRSYVNAYGFGKKIKLHQILLFSQKRFLEFSIL